MTVAVHTHPTPSAGSATEKCPWCGNVISRREFEQIKVRIAEEQRQLLDERLAEEKRRMEERIAALQAEGNQKEQAIRKETAAAAEAQIKAATEATAKQHTTERERLLTNLKDSEESRRHQEERIAALQTERNERDQAIRKEATAQAQAQIKAAAEAAAKHHTSEVQQARAALDKQRQTDLLQQQAQFQRERQLLQQKVDTLTRTLQHKTANELGEGAELDVFEALREDFGRDEIVRIKKGEPGADIRHVVLEKGVPCGTILLDSKDRQRWLNSYVTKLREDQVAEQAEYAILATAVFPAGRKELYVDEDTKVIVVGRSRVVEVVRLLRDWLTKIHHLGLAQTERAGKENQLYEYITSSGFAQHLEEIERLTSDLLQLEADEHDAHNKVWEKRGRALKRLGRATREIDTEIDAIVEGPARGC